MKKFRESVTFILQRPDGAILIQERDSGNGKVIPYPNTWTLPGGEKEEGENFIECVIREVKEEYNVNISSDQCKLILSYDHDGFIGDQVFLCKVSQDIKPQLLEGKTMKWMTIEEIEKFPLAWEQNKIITDIKIKIK